LVDRSLVSSTGSAPSRSVPTGSLAQRPPFPGLARFGLVVMAFGLLVDLVEHDIVAHLDELIVAGFPLSEHLAHLVVLVGMLLVLIGIVRTGSRIGREGPQPTRRLPHAIR
jgi:hypothetical protein